MQGEDILLQEQQLQFHEFSHELALKIGLKAVEKIQARQQKDIGIRIVYQGLLVFQYLMNQKKEDQWLKRKENTVLTIGHASLYAHVVKEPYLHLAGDEHYALGGGGFPIIENGEVKGAICISGLEHTQDHALIVEILQEVIL